MNYEYKTVMFNCAFSTHSNANDKLHEVIKENAIDGWRLHSFQFVDMSSCCICVFERIKEE